jgi:dihydroorotate dehydrogenase (NAD+) catalytic subunit
MKPTLQVDLDGLQLPTPVMVASGCFGWGNELDGLADVSRFGGVVTATITQRPVKGFPTPRIAETPSGLLSAMGLQNPGVEVFLRRHLPALSGLGVPLFVSVGGTTLEEFIRVTAMLQGAQGITALEANLASPDASREGAPFGLAARPADEVIGAMTRLSVLPVFAKLPGDAGPLEEVAEAVVRAGAHGVSLIGAVTGMSIDPTTLRPRLASIEGGLSGPAIRPIAVRAVFRVARALPRVPVIGVGGVATARDAIELILAGAWAVQVGTAMFADPQAPAEIAQGISEYLGEKGLLAPADLRGRVRLPVSSSSRPATPAGPG